MLLKHRLSPSITHCEDSLECVSHTESPTGAALALVLHRRYHLDTALRPIPITWKIQNATIVVESSCCGDQLAHVLEFVSKVRTLKLLLCQIREQSTVCRQRRSLGSFHQPFHR